MAVLADIACAVEVVGSCLPDSHECDSVAKESAFVEVFDHAITVVPCLAGWK